MKDMVGSSTRLLLIRPSSVTLLDFWEGNSPSRSNMATKEKKSDSGPKRATISEVGGKKRRLMGRESTSSSKELITIDRETSNIDPGPQLILFYSIGGHHVICNNLVLDK